MVLCSHLCRKDGKKDQDSRSAPEPKKPDENPASVSIKGFPLTSFWLLPLGLLHISCWCVQASERNFFFSHFLSGLSFLLPDERGMADEHTCAPLTLVNASAWKCYLQRRSRCSLEPSPPFAIVSPFHLLIFDVRIQGLHHLVTLVFYRSSVLQANMLLCPWMVKMKTREKNTPSRPLHPVLFPSLSPLWNIHSRTNQTSIQTRQNKTHHLLETFLNFFLKNEMKFFCMLLQPLKYWSNQRITNIARDKDYSFLMEKLWCFLMIPLQLPVWLVPRGSI
jgi:hypothetical protein